MLFPKMFNKNLMILTWLICFGLLTGGLFGQPVHGEEEEEFDENTKKLAVELLKHSANKTFLTELLAGGESAANQAAQIIDSYPVESIAAVYRDYTFEQIQALEDELLLRDHFIYDPIRDKTAVLKEDFDRACHNYTQNGDIVTFEEKFLTTGYELVSMQKMILRIINNKVEEKLKPGKQLLMAASFGKRTGPHHHGSHEPHGSPSDGRHRPARRSAFEYLSSLFFGVGGPDHFGPVNRMWSLLRSIGREDNLIHPSIPGASLVNWGYDRLKTLVVRLRRVYYTYHLSLYSSSWIGTQFLKPYQYQATLGLVDLVGYRRLTDPLSSALMSQFRFWMNLIAGNVQVNMFSRPGPNSQTTPTIDPQTLQILMKTLQHNQHRQNDKIEQNRINEMLENLAKNQARQQEQIDAILNNLGNKVHQDQHQHQTWTTEKRHSTTTTEKPKWHSSTSTTTTTERPASTSTHKKHHGETMSQLKRQRKLLNELIQELQKPFNESQSSHEHKKHPSSSNSNVNERLELAQKTLMNVMRTVTPLINMMAQNNMVSSETVQKSKLDLLSIVNAVSNRELNDDDDGEQQEEIVRVRQLGEKLEQVLDVIITEANADADPHQANHELHPQLFGNSNHQADSLGVPSPPPAVSKLLGTGRATLNNILDRS